MSDKLSDPTPASPDQSHPTPSPPSIDLQSPDSSFHPLSPSSSLSPSQSRTLGSSQSSPSIRTRPGNGARRNSPTRVGPAMVADLADPAYRLAVSSNTTMREQVSHMHASRAPAYIYSLWRLKPHNRSVKLIRCKSLIG